MISRFSLHHTGGTVEAAHMHLGPHVIWFPWPVRHKPHALWMIMCHAQMFHVVDRALRKTYKTPHRSMRLRAACGLQQLICGHMALRLSCHSPRPNACMDQLQRRVYLNMRANRVASVLITTWHPPKMLAVSVKNPIGKSISTRSLQA